MARTINEKLTAAIALVAKYEAEIAADAISNNIAEGDNVTIKFGRGAKVRDVAGRVIGVRDTDNGRFVAVLDAELNTFKVHVRDVVSNEDADARNTPVPNADVASDEVASDDPLSEA